jgi:predicted nucleotide-binding protein (sugar kinase/HSP70/actin superfamily)
MSSLMNLMEMGIVGESTDAHPHGQQNPFPEKVEDDFSENIFRDLRETISLTRDDETRCIMRTLSVILQIAADSRSHVREINARLDEMASNTKDLRQRTTEVLATVEKENCLNVPQVLLLLSSIPDECEFNSFLL